MQTHADELVLTASGYEELQAELERLTRVRRPEIEARLRQALELAGDLGDNLDYLDALREQEQVEDRIAKLERRLASATVLEPARGPAPHVVIGSWVELEDVDTGGHSRYRLVNSAESDPSHGRLSIESPVGSAVAGHTAGETVAVTTPHGVRHLRIVAADAG